MTNAARVCDFRLATFSNIANERAPNSLNELCENILLNGSCLVRAHAHDDVDEPIGDICFTIYMNIRHIRSMGIVACDLFAHSVRWMDDDVEEEEEEEIAHRSIHSEIEFCDEWGGMVRDTELVEWSKWDALVFTSFFFLFFQIGLQFTCYSIHKWIHTNTLMISCIRPVSKVSRKRWRSFRCRFTKFYCL